MQNERGGVDKGTAVAREHDAHLDSLRRRVAFQCQQPFDQLYFFGKLWRLIDCGQQVDVAGIPVKAAERPVNRARTDLPDGSRRRA